MAGVWRAAERPRGVPSTPTGTQQAAAYFPFLTLSQTSRGSGRLLASGSLRHVSTLPQAQSGQHIKKQSHFASSFCKGPEVTSKNGSLVT